MRLTENSASGWTNPKEPPIDASNVVVKNALERQVQKLVEEKNQIDYLIERANQIITKLEKENHN